MVSIGAKSPGKQQNKRKSIDNAAVKAKIPKIDQTPSKTPITKNTPKGPKSGGKKGAPAAANGEESTPNIKPFGGTSKDKKPNVKAEKTSTVVETPKPKAKTEKPAGSGPEKKKKGQFFNLKTEIQAGSSDVLKKIETRIKAISGRKEMTKTAKRKLKLLEKFKQIALTGSPFPEKSGDKPEDKPVPSAGVSNKSSSMKRRARRGNAKEKKLKLDTEGVDEPSKKIAVKQETKPPQKKGKKGKETVEQKQQKLAMKVKAAEKDASDEEDDEDEEESEGEESDDVLQSDDAAEAEESSGEEEEQDQKASGDEEADSSESDYEVESEVKPDRIVKTEENLDSDDEDEEEEEEEESPRAMKKQKKGPQQSEKKTPHVSDLKKTEILKTGQSRYVVFAGNLPFDATKEDLAAHFSKVGNIKHIRIPLDKETNKPRGFAYVEVSNEQEYQRALSLHHSQLKGRRINVLYTKGGEKQGGDKKQEVKAKNLKLQAMRKQGQLAGSNKNNQKRADRRKKQNPRPVNGN